MGMLRVNVSHCAQQFGTAATRFTSYCQSTASLTCHATLKTLVQKRSTIIKVISSTVHDSLSPLAYRTIYWYSTKMLAGNFAQKNRCFSWVNHFFCRKRKSYLMSLQWRFHTVALWSFNNDFLSALSSRFLFTAYLPFVNLQEEK